MNARLRPAGRVLPILLALAFGAATAAGTMVWMRIQLQRQRNELVELTQRHRDLLADLERLEIQAAALAAPKRIEREAARIGLVHPDRDQVVRISEAGAP